MSVEAQVHLNKLKDKVATCSFCEKDSHKCYWGLGYVYSFCFDHEYLATSTLKNLKKSDDHISNCFYFPWECIECYQRVTNECRSSSSSE